MNSVDLIGQKLLLAFQGKQFTPEMAQSLASYKPGGVTFFRSFNIGNPEQVKKLVSDLQNHAHNLGLPPLLIGTDQEGGQLMAVGEGTTPLPGNMALGAAGSTKLARRTGEVLGRELAAMGINMNYAPCCDVNVNPRNPVIGTRSFGEDPKQVALMAAAMVEGIQSQGVAAVAKHFPGHGDTSADSHLGLPSLPHSLERLQSVEFIPFQAAIDADVKLTMSAHIAMPAIDGNDAPPATLSKAILTGLLREQLGFEGVIVSDAMDMQAIQQGENLGEECARASTAGIDLLLMTADPVDHKRAWNGLTRSYQYDLQFRVTCEHSAERIEHLKSWLAAHQTKPGLEVLGCADHLAVADEIAERSVTLVRNDAHLLPLSLDQDQRIGVIIPQPADLTPADTSSYVVPALASSIREFHSNVDEIVIPFAPNESVIQKVLEQVQGAALVIVGTINAFDCPAQAELVNKLLQSGIPTVVTALRMPYDLISFDKAPTYLCTYSIQSPSMVALAKILFGKLKPQGCLPVSIPGLYPNGYRLV
ncbi:MAG: glycoside hydrolase family 3 [Chloroflexi bacterium HGW-Chloroflexi-4]|nr:MAG: glycoside hydrolase family 3 [Chloroflexi bacterium HGW-Chloroflexi-4]